VEILSRYLQHRNHSRHYGTVLAWFAIKPLHLTLGVSFNAHTYKKMMADRTSILRLGGSLGGVPGVNECYRDFAPPVRKTPPSELLFDRREVTL